MDYLYIKKHSSYIQNHFKNFMYGYYNWGGGEGRMRARTHTHTHTHTHTKFKYLANFLFPVMALMQNTQRHFDTPNNYQ